MGEQQKKYGIRSLMIAIGSLAMITGFVMLFMAGAKDRNESDCKGIHLAVKGDPAHTYVSRDLIKAALMNSQPLNPVGKPLSGLNTARLEAAVKAFPWVAGAELYVDNDNILQVTITERIPVARVFATSSSSFFLDSGGRRLPVNGSFATRLPVFTGFPDARALTPSRDSALVKGITAVAGYLAGHPFWMAQVEQVNINNNLDFELIPAVGSALILLGDGTDITDKLSRLLVFYRQGLNNIGWDYYDTLDLRFRGQVVASRKRGNHNPVVDSLLTEDSYQHPSPHGPRLTMRPGIARDISWTASRAGEADPAAAKP